MKFRLIATPMLSLALITIGASLLTTVQSVYLHKLHYSTLLIGSITTVYYLGFIYAAFHIEKFIIRVGHIRAYAALSALYSTLVIIQGLFPDRYLWLLIRVIAGYCMAGLFVTIESWLLNKSSIGARGQVLAIYMIVYYAGQMAAQFFLNIGLLQILILFAIASLLCTLSIVPLAMTRVASPQIEKPSVINFKNLYKLSPTGVMGCLISGMLIGPLYGLLPIVVAKFSTIKSISFGMASTIFGGMVWQYPLGYLSDHIDRRLVLIIATGISLIVSLLLIFLNTNETLWFLLLFILGGTVFTIYPLAMSHATDVLDSKVMISAVQGLILYNSVGMVAGPLLAAVSMYYLKPVLGFFGYIVVISIILMLFFLWRKRSGQVVVTEEQQEFVALPRITPVAVEIDPRIE